jgi:hypothetical protein
MPKNKGSRCQARFRPGGRGPSGPWPQPVHLRQTSKLTSKSSFGVQVVRGLYAIGVLKENRVGLG